MADRLPSFLPQSLLTRIAVLVLVALGATAGLTFAAGSQLASAPAVPTVSTAPPAPVIVPDVRNQAFVFAKGSLEEAGFAWQVTGSVRGYASNVVIAQSPAPGTALINNGAPRITLTLKRSSYLQSGEPADASPYDATAPQPADLAGRPLGPAAPAAAQPQTVLPKAAKPAKAKTTSKTAAAPATTTSTPATTTTATMTTARSAATAAPAVSAKPAQAAKWPQQRPAAFKVPGARTEPLDEMPLPDRTKTLATWLDAHPTMTSASAKYWLYQNQWIVTGAKLGWWRGAEALKTLVAVDRRAQALWGIGAQSAAVAEQALGDVQARAK